VDGGHQTFGDAEAFLEQHVDDGSEAVRGAARVGDDVVLGGVVLVVVHAHDDGDVFALGRGGDDDLLGAGGDVALGLFGVGEQTGGLDDDIDAEAFQGSSAGVLALTTRISWPLTTRTSSSALSGLDFLEETCR
jgi:hypothetical protein